MRLSETSNERAKRYLKYAKRLTLLTLITLALSIYSFGLKPSGITNGLGAYLFACFFIVPEALITFIGFIVSHIQKKRRDHQENHPTL